MKGHGRDPGKLRPVVAFSLLLLEDSGGKGKSSLVPFSRGAVFYPLRRGEESGAPGAGVFASPASEVRVSHCDRPRSG